MSLHMMVFLLGLFGVPAGLLWLGHRLRRRTPLRAQIFWGGVMGHLWGAVLAVTVGLSRPVQWASGEVIRGFLGYWGLLLFPLVGGLVGALWTWRRSQAGLEPGG